MSRDHHGHNLARFGILHELADARAEDHRGRHGRRAAEKMDCARTSEVQDLAVQESLRAPNPVRRNGIDESREENGVHHVRAEAYAFGDGTRNDRGGSPGKHHLEEPEDVIVVTLQEEVTEPDEGITLAVGKGEAACPIDQHRNAAVHEILRKIMPMSSKKSSPTGTWPLISSSP